MTSHLPFLAASAMLVLTSILAPAAEPPPKPKTTKSAAAKDGPWNVQIEVLMVAMPESKALALLPTLQRPEQTESAVAQIFAAIERKEATLVGYPVVHTLDRQRIVTETIVEKRYPTEFDWPRVMHDAMKAVTDPAPKPITEKPLPAAFETRNTGVTLEAEPTVQPGGTWIEVALVPQHVVLLGFDTYDVVKTADDQVAKVDQPLFATAKSTTTLRLRSGQWQLIGVHKVTKPENQIELHLVRTTASPAR